MANFKVLFDSIQTCFSLRPTQVRLYGAKSGLLMFFAAFALMSDLALCAEPETPSQLDFKTVFPPQAAPDQPLTPTAKEFTAETFYQVLLGEIAGQRGEYRIASQAYAKAAESTRDLSLIRRATEVTLFSRNYVKASELAQSWLKQAPDAKEAKQSLITALLYTNRLDAARPYLAEYLQNNSTKVGEVFLQLGKLLTESKNTPENPDTIVAANPSAAKGSTAFELVSELAKPYFSVPEAQYTVAYLGLLTGLSELSVVQKSLAAVERAILLKPDWEKAVILKSQLLLQSAPQKSATILQDFLQAHPESYEVHVALGMMRYEQRKLESARNHLRKAVQLNPKAQDLRLRVALISLQLKDAAAAREELHKLAADNYPNADALHYFLGQAYELDGDLAAALKELQAVDSEDLRLSAQLEIAMVLAKQNDLTEARAHLQRLNPSNELEQIRILQTETQILREAGETEAALALLREKTIIYPQAIELHYELGMLAEQLDHLDLAEKAFRQVIELNPKLPLAYNALGYAFANRNTNLTESLTLLEKAHALAPHDPAILDSLGWVYYRLGKTSEAIRYLQQAHQAHEDPEIAAHLGEVLWKTGAETEAKAVWHEQLKKTPASSILQETMQRFLPESP